MQQWTASRNATGCGPPRRTPRHVSSVSSESPTSRPAKLLTTCCSPKLVLTLPTVSSKCTETRAWWTRRSEGRWRAAVPSRRGSFSRVWTLGACLVPFPPGNSTVGALLEALGLARAGSAGVPARTMEPEASQESQLRQLGSSLVLTSGDYHNKQQNKFLIVKSPTGDPRSMMHPSVRAPTQPPGAVGKSRMAGGLDGQARQAARHQT